MLVAASPHGEKTYFWTGVLCGATLSVVALTWLTRPAASKKKSTTPEYTSRALALLGGDETQVHPSFLTDIMEQLWAYMKIAGAETIRASVEPSFAELPGPMKTCRFTKLDLGKVPMRMDNIKVHPLQPDGSIQFDMDLEWDGDCDFQLKADYIGTFGVRSLKLSGRMAIILKPLTNQLPVISGIQYGFINMPTIDLSFSGLASVAELSVLESTVQEALKSSLSTTVLPNRRLYKMNAANNYLDTYQPPVGVLRLTIQRGKGFVIEKRFLAKDDIPDVYLNVSLGALPDTWRTKTVEDNLNPQWDEMGDFCLYDRDQFVQIHGWDEDGGPLDPDDDLGKAKVTVTDMLMSRKRTVTLPLYAYNNKKQSHEKTGASVTLSCDVCAWTKDLNSLEDSNTNPRLHNEICGLLVVIINRAFDLPLDQKTACTFVKVTYGDKEYDSKMIYDYPGWDSLNPIYDTGITIPITKQMPRDDKAKIQLELINLVNEKSTIVGSHTITFASLRESTENTLTEICDIGKKGGTLEYRVSLSGVMPPPPKGITVDTRSSALAPGTSFDSPSPSRTPKLSRGNSVRFDLEDDAQGSTFQLTVVKARGLKIREELFGFDVPDVYFKIYFDGDVFTTTVKHNNVTPKWDETKNWKLKDHGQVVSIQGWDRNERERDPDVPIGTVKTTVGNLLLAGGPLELELMNDKDLPTGVFITVRAVML